MAEGILKDLMSKYLSHVPDGEIIVSSAGICAKEGDPINPHSITCLSKHNISHSEMSSTQLTRSIVDSADYVLCMTESHLGNAERMRSSSYTKTQVRLLGSFGEGVQAETIPDPYGEDLETYEKTFEKLRFHSRKFMDSVLLRLYPPI
ncbi:low molecular weight phosphotyrosine protein phosphatase-like isoform X2 [Watersipora subatra]